MIKKFFNKGYFLIFCFVFFTGCATPYQKQTWYAYRGGYFDKKLSDNSFAIIFNGNALILDTTAIDYALLRSAEVAKNNGFKYFTIAINNEDTIYSEMYNNVKSLVNKPSVINIIYCYNDKPLKNSLKVYEADEIIRQIRYQYDIK